MDTGRLCMFCMEDNGGQDVCPHCGRDANAPLLKNHLAPGEVIGGRFLVGRAVGQDASGIVYIVFDLRKERKMRIREFMPRGVAGREEGSNELKPLPGMEAEFAEGLDETRARAESKDEPEKAMPCFEENGTLYVVLRRRKAEAEPAEAAAAVAEEAGKKTEKKKKHASDEENDDRKTEFDEEEDDGQAEESRGSRIKRNALTGLVALLIVLLLVASVVYFATRDSRDNTNQPVNSGSPLDVWAAPTETPRPTLAATDSFGNIVAPTQGWQYQQGGNNINYSVATNTPIPDDYEPDWLRATPDPATIITQVPTATPEGWIDPNATAVPDGWVDPNATALPVDGETPEPTVEPTPRVTLEPVLVNKNTPEAIVRALQSRLIELGWLDIAEPTGYYGDQTKKAVRDFQKIIHDRYDATMEVDGFAGEVTVGWLNRDDAPWNPDREGAQPLPDTLPTVTPAPTPSPVPTATPEPTDTPEPTATPEPTPTPFIPSEATTREAQGLLIELGWLDASQLTGVWDNATRMALSDFQKYLNSINPDVVLPTDGNADDITMTWLRWTRAPHRPDVIEYTPEPETTATPEPTVIYSETIGPESDEEAVLWLQGRLIELGWLKGEPNGLYDDATRMGVSMLQTRLNARHSLSLDTSGIAGSATLNYINNDYNIERNPDPERAPTLTARAAAQPDGGEPRQGVDAATNEGADETPAPTVEPTPDPVEETTPEPTDEPTPVPTDEPTPEPTPEPTDEPTPEPTPEPTDEPTPEPTDEPTPEPTLEPALYEQSTEQEIIAFKARLVELGWIDEETELTGEYDAALKKTIEAVQTWLRANWDEAKWGDAEKNMPAVNGEFVDGKTWNVIFSDNRPEKPEDYVIQG